MSLPYMPFYVSDFEADTAHLSLAEDGAYNRLLRLCWRTPGCSIPDDDQWIMRRLRVSEEAYREIIRPVLDEFFQTKKARLFSPKLLKIFRESKTTHKKRSEAGKKGGRPAKQMKNNEKHKSRDKAGIKPGQSNQNHNQVNNKPPVAPLTDGELGEAFEAFNTTAQVCGLPQAQTLTDKRRRALKARLVECNGLEGWGGVLAKIEASPFLRGDNNRGWRADFDWMLQQSSFTKLMEGVYDNRVREKAKAATGGSKWW